MHLRKPQNLPKVLFLLALLIAAPLPVFAQETEPGDACGTAGLFRATGGAENPDGHLVFCDGAVWQPILGYSATGGWVMFGSGGLAAAPLHVSGEAIIGEQGLACTAATEGGIRYNSTGQIIDYCNGGAWQAIGGGTPAGVDREIQFNSGGAFGSTNTFKLMADGDLLLSGTYTGTASVPATGAGTRMFFDTQKAAFRAGGVSGTQWDNASIGNYSVAMGNSTIASGDASTAMGDFSFATGFASTAMGSNGSASGNYSTVFGYGNKAIGGYGMAGGYFTSAGGLNSVAIGREAVALGDYSFAFGLGDSSFVTQPKVSGTSSFGIFMGNHSAVNFAAANTMGLFGGKMVIDPAVPATYTVANAALDVAGGVKIANDAAACVAAKNGTIRYVSGGNPPWEFCNGSAWSPFKQPRCVDDATGECYLAAPRSGDDPDFIAANIADGVNILGVTGTFGSGVAFFSATAMSVGDNHLCALKADGTAWCWGEGTNGKLGNAGTSASYAPAAVDLTGVSGTAWTKISVGTNHSCGTRDNGTAWCWGKGSFGQRGDSSTVATQSTPVQVGTTGVSGSNWTEIHAGADHTCGLRDDNTAWCWGRDTYGEVGDDAAFADKSAPVAVSTAGVSGTGWSGLGVGSNHSCGLRDDGTGWCWGRDNIEQLGDGAGAADQGTPVAISLTGVSGTGWASSPRGGANYTCGIRNDGTGWCWGENNNSRLGDGIGSTDRNSPQTVNTANVTGSNWTTINPQIDTSANAHTCGIRDDGTGYCWGENSNAEVGIGAAGGWQNEAQAIIVTDLPGTNWLEIGAASGASCGLRNNNVIYCWGTSDYRFKGDAHFGVPYTGVAQ